MRRSIHRSNIHLSSLPMFTVAHSTLLCVAVLLVSVQFGDAQTCSVPSSQVLWRSNFAPSNWLDSWKATGKWGLENVNQWTDGKVNAIRVKYPKGSANPGSAPPEGGAGWKGRNLTPRDSVYLFYYIKFHSSFQWVKGGKLPGLYGGAGNSGGDTPNGSDGWSTRYMWRTNGAGEVYAYYPNCGDYGASLGRGSWYFTAGGGWHRLQQYIKMNTPGKKDGIIKSWYDGKLVYSNSSVLFRTVSSLKIDGIMFSTFFGGSNKDWATPVDTYVYYYDFILSDKYINC